MSHFDNEDDEFLILDRIQDSPYALPNSISVRSSREFFAATRARIISKLGDTGRHLLTDLFGFDILDFLGDWGLKANVISCHGASMI